MFTLMRLRWPQCAESIHLFWEVEAARMVHPSSATRSHWTRNSLAASIVEPRRRCIGTWTIIPLAGIDATRVTVQLWHWTCGAIRITTLAGKVRPRLRRVSVDDKQFDDFARILAGPTSRRATVRSIGGGALGAVFGSSALPMQGRAKKEGQGQEEEDAPACANAARSAAARGSSVVMMSVRSAVPLTPSAATLAPALVPAGSSEPLRKPWGNDAAPSECCPPERQWFTTRGWCAVAPPGRAR